MARPTRRRANHGDVIRRHDPVRRNDRPREQHQDGYSSSELAGFSVGTDGTLTGTYTNGKTQSLGQIALATFAQPERLAGPWRQQLPADRGIGLAQVSVPGSTNHGSLQGGAVENSNVDLTSSLVDLITAQRNYQANAQTIKTQQTVDQTLINL